MSDKTLTPQPGEEERERLPDPSGRMLMVVAAGCAYILLRLMGA